MKWIVIAIFAVGMMAGGDKVSLADIAEEAVRQSKIDSPGSKPFHLKASIVETTNPDSEYKAAIEEFWLSPSQWRRTINSPQFSQTLIVNGDDVSEEDTGDYFPVWLNHLVGLMTDPIPMLSSLKQSSAMIEKPRGASNSSVCADLHSQVDRWVICFGGQQNPITSVFMKGNAAEFKDYKSFGSKHVARTLTTDPEPGTTIELRITELKELTEPDASLFIIKQKASSADRIASVRIDEETFRKLVVSSMDVQWPPTGGGLATGGCAVYASADRKGRVREVWPEGCDNTGLEQPLRDAVSKWLLKPATSKGTPVQVEALLGFTFHTDVSAGNQLPQLTDSEARQLATKVVEPDFSQSNMKKGTQVTVEVSVDEKGRVTGTNNPHGLDMRTFMAVHDALIKWEFRPYFKDGKAQYFHADIVFVAR